jgi:hypothetical protein
VKEREACRDEEGVELHSRRYAEGPSTHFSCLEGIPTAEVRGCRLETWRKMAVACVHVCNDDAWTCAGRKGAENLLVSPVLVGFLFFIFVKAHNPHV